MIQNVRDFLDARLGIHTESRASADGVTLGVTPASVINQNPRRIRFDFVNLSANTVYLTPIGVPSANKGYYVGPNGGTLSFDAEEDGEIVAWDWRAMATAAGTAYYVLETLLIPAAQGA